MTFDKDYRRKLETSPDTHSSNVFIKHSTFTSMVLLRFRGKLGVFHLRFIFAVDRLGSGVFGDVHLAEAVGIVCFEPRERASMRQRPLLIRKRSRSGSASSRSGNSYRRHVTKVAVKKLKGMYVLKDCRSFPSLISGYRLHIYMKFTFFAQSFYIFDALRLATFSLAWTSHESPTKLAAVLKQSPFLIRLKFKSHEFFSVWE